MADVLLLCRSEGEKKRVVQVFYILYFFSVKKNGKKKIEKNKLHQAPECMPDLI